MTSQGTRDGPAKHTQRGATDPPRCQAHLPWTQQLCPFPRTCAWDSGSSAATALPHTRRGVSLLGLCPCRIDFSVSLRGSPTKALSPAGAPAAGATARVSPIKRHTRTLDDFETVRMAPPRARAVHGVPEGQTFCPARTNFTHSWVLMQMIMSQKTGASPGVTSPAKSRGDASPAAASTAGQVGGAVAAAAAAAQRLLLLQRRQQQAVEAASKQGRPGA